MKDFKYLMLERHHGTIVDNLNSEDVESSFSLDGSQHYHGPIDLRTNVIASWALANTRKSATIEGREDLVVFDGRSRRLTFKRCRPTT